MRYSTTLSMLSGIAALSGFAMAHPLFDSQLVKRDSPDDTCGLVVGGAGNGYTCGASNTGTCCSQYGYCGATADYCGTGCQAAYGTGCTGGGGGTNPNLCGPNNGGASCVTGSCCSANGFCGTTADYCLPANGCQAAYGICNSTNTGGGGGNCGPANGNAVCPTGQCCSPAGFCGTTEDYCRSPDCLRGFGTCDSDKTPAGDSTANVPRPLIGSVNYDEDIYPCAGNPGQIALTYDDGPYLYTNDLLDILAAYGFKATFFVTGVNNGKGPIDSTPAWTSVIQRMIADGHQVASHTWSHADLSKLSDADRTTEMVKNEMAIRNIIGKFPTYMRPPFSSCNAACKVTMKNLGYHITYFDFDTQDYLHITPETNQISKDVVHSILDGANPSKTNPAPGSLLAIAHDIHQQTVHNLTTYMFDQMVQYGFTGVTTGKCLNDPEANWYRTPGASK